jgi:hypothetical protein
MSVALLRFSSSELLLTQEQAWKILRFFWPDMNTPPNSLTVNDRSFAQALLIEAIDGSYNMGFVKLIFDYFFMKPPTSFGNIKDMVKIFVKAAMNHWFKHATGANLKDPKIYESVRLTLARNFRTTWKIREESGELIY